MSKAPRAFDTYFTRHIVEDEHGWIDWRLQTGGVAEIVNIEVDAAWRGRGVGTKLFERMLAELPPEVGVVYAFTTRSNVLAQAWYRKQGFELTLVPRFYAARGEDAFCCVRRVQGSGFRVQGSVTAYGFFRLSRARPLAVSPRPPFFCPSSFCLSLFR